MVWQWDRCKQLHVLKLCMRTTPYKYIRTYDGYSVMGVTDGHLWCAVDVPHCVVLYENYSIYTHVLVLMWQCNKFMVMS